MPTPIATSHEPAAYPRLRAIIHGSNMTMPAASTPPAKTSLAAFASAGFPAYLCTYTLTMMADNVEHVISYWVAFRKFHSPTLGGFAVVSHWLPYLLFSVAIGSLNDRVDSRRIIQAGACLFAFVSACWGYLFATDSLEVWHAMALLALHGCASVLWQTSSQVLLYDIVGPATLASAVRLSATARYLGVLVGPGVGSLIMLAVGPTYGIMLNTVFYLPLIVWLVRAPHGRHIRGGAPAPRAVRGLNDIARTAREVVRSPVLVSMISLAGAASFFVGNSYHAQMPSFASDLGHGDPGMTYGMLLGADAAGALLAGAVLELRARTFTISPPVAVAFAIGWASSLAMFALTRSYPFALGCLFCAGFCELCFSTINQTLVQMSAPDASRGRVLGLYGMAASGLRTFSGLTVGILGSGIGVHVSLGVASAAVGGVGLVMLVRMARTHVGRASNSERTNLQATGKGE